MAALDGRRSAGVGRPGPWFREALPPTGALGRRAVTGAVGGRSALVDAHGRTAPWAGRAPALRSGPLRSKCTAALVGGPAGQCPAVVGPGGHGTSPARARSSGPGASPGGLGLGNGPAGTRRVDERRADRHRQRQQRGPGPVPCPELRPVQLAGPCGHGHPARCLDPVRPYRGTAPCGNHHLQANRGRVAPAGHRPPGGTASGGCPGYGAHGVATASGGAARGA